MIRYIAFLTITLLLTVSCSGDSEPETAQIATSPPTAMVTPSAATPTQVPPTPKPEHLLDFEGLEQNVNEVSRIAWEDSQRILA